MARLPRKISAKDLLRGFQRLTIPVQDIVPVNLLSWILAEAKITRQEFLKLLKWSLRSD